MAEGAGAPSLDVEGLGCAGWGYEGLMVVSVLVVLRVSVPGRGVWE